MTQASWIAVDWGTTHLRAWAMSDDDQILDQRSSDQGMGKLSRDGFEPALRSLIAGWDNAGAVIACGMVGSRQGWVEAPYASVPCAPHGTASVAAPVRDMSVRVIPGLKQMDPADVMRGEETQIAGFLAQNPNWDGVICLPGTHSKWAHISADEVVSFQTFMTGEMFSLLSNNSVLRHSIGDGWDDEAFDAAVSDTLSRPEKLGARLFALRAQDLLLDQNADSARATLSGLLIGAELAATKPYWLGQNIALIGASALSQAYAKALRAQGLVVTLASGDDMTLAGLAAAHKRYKETS